MNGQKWAKGWLPASGLVWKCTDPSSGRWATWQFCEVARGADDLGEAFRNAVEKFDPDRMNLFPLLHISIARGRFLQAHDYFTRIKGGNYFDFVSRQLADRLIAHRDSPRLRKLWIAERERAATA